MSIQNNLSITLQELDVNGQVTTRRVFTVSDTAAVVGEFRSGVLVDTNQVTITVPTTQPRQILFKNTHASAKITVVWTPYGGAEATINKVGPGGIIALWDATAAATGIGVSSLKLTSDTNNATYELFIGG